MHFKSAAGMRRLAQPDVTDHVVAKSKAGAASGIGAPESPRKLAIQSTSDRPAGRLILPGRAAAL